MQPRAATRTKVSKKGVESVVKGRMGEWRDGGKGRNSIDCCGLYYHHYFLFYLSLFLLLSRCTSAVDAAMSPAPSVFVVVFAVIKNIKNTNDINYMKCCSGYPWHMSNASFTIPIKEWFFFFTLNFSYPFNYLLRGKQRTCLTGVRRRYMDMFVLCRVEMFIINFRLLFFLKNAITNMALP